MLLADILFISETWLSPNCSLNLYNIPTYKSFHNVRQGKPGGGASIYIHDNFPSAQLSNDISSNNAFKISAVTIGQGK